MGKSYKPIKSMKEVPEQLRKLRRQYLRYQQAEIIYSISHKKLFELASDAGAIYRIDGTVLINRDIFDDYLERFHEQAQERYELIEEQMRSVEGVTEALKARNPMEWVRQCNNIRNRVQEIVLGELVYV